MIESLAEQFKKRFADIEAKRQADIAALPPLKPRGAPRKHPTWAHRRAAKKKYWKTYYAKNKDLEIFKLKRGRAQKKYANKSKV